MLQPYIAEQERRIFRDQVEWFINQWAPEQEPVRTEFVCDLMLVIRDLGMQRGRAYHEATVTVMKELHSVLSLSPMPPIAKDA